MGNNKYAVIGLGVFGTAIARTLTERGSEVIAIDNDAKKIERMKGVVRHTLEIDSTNKRVLEAQNLTDLEAVVVAIGKDFEALLLTAVHLKEMGINRIIVRANGPQQQTILEQIGFKEILSPENEVGIAVAERLLNPNILSSLQLRDDYEIDEVKAPARTLGRTLAEIGLRERFNLTVVTIKREYRLGLTEDGETTFEKRVLGVPSPATIIQNGDTLIVFGQISDIEKFTLNN
ncbi:MAG: potassium channel family protein [Salibacteraceae bacterium]